MGGTKQGGIKARDTNYKKHGKDFYKKIGALQHEGWIANGKKPRGFAYMKLHGRLDEVRKAGSKGGEISRRPKDVR